MLIIPHRYIKLFRRILYGIYLVEMDTNEQYFKVLYSRGPTLLQNEVCVLRQIFAIPIIRSNIDDISY